MMKLLSLLIASASAEGVAETVQTVSPVAETPLMTKGLIVTAGGLAGVFLVLCLFFATIKVMQKVSK